MRFQIQASDPTNASGLKAVLEAERDKWRAETEQDHPVGSPQHGELEEARADVDRQRTLNTDKDGGAALRGAVKRLANVVKTHSATPGPDMAGALALIDKGIAAAVLMTGDKPVRVTVHGHFHSKPKATLGLQGNLTHLVVTVNDASFEGPVATV